jgi:hypothetical protein
MANRVQAFSMRLSVAESVTVVKISLHTNPQ